MTIQPPAATRLADTPTWESLMEAAQSGDARAYDRLLREALPLLRAIARRRIANAAEAEDAVQDALLTVHRLRHTYDPTRPLRPWLAALCERRCIDRLRRTARRGRQASTDDLADVLEAPGAGEAAMARLAAAELRAAVEALPTAQRIALRLTRLEELPLAEASRASGRSVAVLKMGTHRAIRSLRLRLAS